MYMELTSQNGQCPTQSGHPLNQHKQY